MSAHDIAVSVPAAGLNNWQIKSSLPGRVRLKNPILYRKQALSSAIERALAGVLGIHKFSTNSLTSTVLVNYDPKQLTQAQVIEILDDVLASAEQPARLDDVDMHLPICTASLPLAASAQFVAAPLLMPAAALYAFTSIPTFKEARRVFVEEKRIGVDALDAVVMAGCLGTMSIFPGAVCCWCLSFGRFLVKQSRDRSQKLLTSAFGKQPRSVWFCRGETEVQVPVEKLQKGDVIVVHTGEAIPVDGHVVAGMALVDQHALTGEATPAEKGAGDRVFASTLLVAGEIKVAVEMSGSETASARIGQILSDTAGYKMSSQHKGERLADKAVLPTLGAGALGMAMMGPLGAVAVLNSDLGTGIRMAVPLAMLSSLTLCASKGILVKDGRALETMNQIDTVLFDKTGTLTRDQPEVGRVITANDWSSDQILGFAAAAERKFHHPIAMAIRHRAEQLGLTLPPTDDSQYKVGYGITVQIDGHTVRVGSKPLHPESRRGSNSTPGPSKPWMRRIKRGTRWSWWAWTINSAARSSSGRPCVRRCGPSSRVYATAGSRTSRLSRATTTRRPKSSRNRWKWIATSRKYSLPTRPIMWQNCRRKGARSVSSAMVSMTRSHSKRRMSRSRFEAHRPSRPTRPMSSSSRGDYPGSAT